MCATNYTAACHLMYVVSCPTQADGGGLPDSNQNELAWILSLADGKILLCCLQILHQLCEHLSAVRPSTLEDDVALLQQLQSAQSRDVHAVLALQFRISKKQLLQACLWQHDPQQFH